MAIILGQQAIGFAQSGVLLECLATDGGPTLGSGVKLNLLYQDLTTVLVGAKIGSGTIVP